MPALSLSAHRLTMFQSLRGFGGCVMRLETEILKSPSSVSIPERVWGVCDAARQRDFSLTFVTSSVSIPERVWGGG